MAIEAHYGDAGRSLWDEWSLTAKDKYNERDQDRTWRSLKGSGVGYRARYFTMASMADGRMVLRSSMKNGAGSRPPRKMMSRTAFANGILVKTPACHRRANGCSALRSVGHS